VTQYGGIRTADGSANGNGTIFKINADGSGYTNLYSFGGTANDGANPFAGLILSGTTLYGTTAFGGTNGNGEVFKINTDGSEYANLYSFVAANGVHPKGPLLLANGVLYGMTSGENGDGPATIYRINTSGSGYTNLYTFPDGADPVATLILAGNTLYGTTKSGGTNGDGEIFSINTNGSGYTNLYSFTGSPDGANPVAGLTLSSGTLYGTTENGGAYYDGTIFSVNIGGGGYTVLRSFGSFDTDYGTYPEADLVMLGNSLYGTTYRGGAHGYGMVFCITTNGTDFNDVYDFAPSADGQDPLGGLGFP
jgi:uncharacterized repeat protein (TIGR03803 family)